MTFRSEWRLFPQISANFQYAVNVDTAQEPLPGERLRQAAPMFRGCEYQIWQTVNAWLDLQPAQLLFVEGAEDFDVVGPDGAEAVQIKATVGTISLGRQDAREAINNFWRLRARAPSQGVRLRFLTRSLFGVEQGQPFGVGVAGLELWMRPQLLDEEVARIAEFLRKQDGLEQSLLDWLGTAPASEVCAELLQRLTWETGSESVDVVERVVQAKLASFAEARGAPPAASKTKAVAIQLFSEVWKILRSDDARSLDRFRLEELWEEGVRVSVPQSAVDALLHGVRSSSNVGRVAVEDFERGAPPAPALVAQRPVLVVRARSVLSSKGFLNLHGSALTGKTTLAKLVLGPEASDWTWWSAARRQPAEIASSLSGLRRSLGMSPRHNSVVLDDLEFVPLALKQYEEVVAELFLILRARRGRLLITSQREVSSSLLHVIGCDGEQAILVPELDLAEIVDLATQFGCPDDEEHRLWSRVVLAHTLGHPQLVAASLLLLRQRNWPPTSAVEAEIAHQKTEAEKSDARQLLAALTEGQRMLLHRLSVFPHVFKRIHAVEIGALPPPLAAPGDLFEPLIGPWVEPLHSGYFALSTLLLGSARSTFAAEDLRRLQNAAAKILVAPEDRTTVEGAMAFQLVWETKNEEAITGLMSTWMTMEHDLFAHIADGLRWFTRLATDRGDILYPANRHLSFFLRGLQLRVGVVTEVPNLRAIVTAWLMEASSPPLIEDPTNRAVLAIQVLPYFQIRLSGQLVINLLSDVQDALKIHPALGDTFRHNPWPETDWPIPHDLFDSLVFFVLWRCDNRKFLAELVAAMTHIPADLRADIVKRLRMHPASVRIAVDRVWLTEENRPEPEWDHCLAALETAFHASVSWNCAPMAVACIRGIAVILDEYQHKPQDAHAAIIRLAAIAGTESHEIADRQASVFFSEENYLEAEKSWAEALSKWPPASSTFDHSAAFAARSTAISAAKQERWDAAAAWFLEIPNRLPVPRETYLVAGAHADAAYAFWKAERREQAIRSLVEAWHLADSLPEGRDDLRAFNTRKIIAHVVAWFHGQVTDVEPGPHFEPLPGMCSSPHLPEKARELAADNPDNLWLFLIRMERVSTSGDRAAILALGRVSNAENPDTRALGIDEAIIHNLLGGKLSDLPSKVVSLARAMKAAAQVRPYPSAGTLESMDPETFYPDDALLGIPVFVGALLSAALHEQPWEVLLSGWRKSVSEFSNAVSWTSWFDEVQGILGAPVHEAARIARDAGHSRSTLLLAWLNLSTGADVSPEDLFLAHARWITHTYKTAWLKELGILYCRLIERAWSRVIARPALLRTPRLSVPAIEAAFNLERSSWSKAAQILLAASAAVTTRLSPEMEIAVRRLLS